MKTFIKLFSNEKGEIYRFLERFYGSSQTIFSSCATVLEWEQSFDNPVTMADMIGVFIDNMDDFKINMWVCLDEGLLINVTKDNVNDLIRYLYERFPY